MGKMHLVVTPLKDLCVKPESKFVTVILDGFSKERRTTKKYFHFPNPLIFEFLE